MQGKEYNGWANYETWAVGMFLDGNYTGEGTYLEVLDLVRDVAAHGDLHRIAEYLQSWFEEILPELDGIAADLLGAACCEIDWRELASHKLSEIAEEER